jgi:hypothetical protein
MMAKIGCGDTQLCYAAFPPSAGTARCPKKPNGQKRQMMVTCHPAAGQVKIKRLEGLAS